MPAFAHGVPDGKGDTVFEADLITYGVHDPVDPRNVAVTGGRVRTAQACEPQNSSLDRDRRPFPSQRDDRGGCADGQGTGASDETAIQMDDLSPIGGCRR